MVFVGRRTCIKTAFIRVSVLQGKSKGSWVGDLGCQSHFTQVISDEHNCDFSIGTPSSNFGPSRDLPFTFFISKYFEKAIISIKLENFHISLPHCKHCLLKSRSKNRPSMLLKFFTFSFFRDHVPQFPSWTEDWLDISACCCTCVLNF